jgi:pimeloyl-ACP methyl ester carboxylesterase
VIVLWGARDVQLPLEDAFEYARRLRARLRLVADCGHLVIVERPHAVLDALAELAA